jgi:hypothetical protein
METLSLCKLWLIDGSRSAEALASRRLSVCESGVDRGETAELESREPAGNWEPA